MLAHAFGIARDIDAGHEHAPGARPQQAAQHADDGRLAGAVRADEAHDFAAGDAKAHMIDGGEVAEPLDQIFDDDLSVAACRRRS